MYEQLDLGIKSLLIEREPKLQDKRLIMVLEYQIKEIIRN